MKGGRETPSNKKDTSQLVVDIVEIRDKLTQNITKLRQLAKKDKFESADEFNELVNTGFKILASLFIGYFLLKSKYIETACKSASEAVIEAFDEFLQANLKNSAKEQG